MTKLFLVQFRMNKCEENFLCLVFLCYDSCPLLFPGTTEIKRLAEYIWYCFCTVEPILSGTILSGYPIFSHQLPKSQICLPLITVIFTSFKWSPQLSGGSHPLLSCKSLFVLFSTYIEQHLKPNLSYKTKNNL